MSNNTNNNGNNYNFSNYQEPQPVQPPTPNPQGSVPVNNTNPVPPTPVNNTQPVMEPVQSTPEPVIPQPVAPEPVLPQGVPEPALPSPTATPQAINNPVAPAVQPEPFIPEPFTPEPIDINQTPLPEFNSQPAELAPLTAVGSNIPTSMPSYESPVPIQPASAAFPMPENNQNLQPVAPVPAPSPIPQNYNIPTMPGDVPNPNFSSGYTSTTPSALINDNNPPEKTGLKKFLPFIIIGLIGIIALIVILSLLFSNRNQTPVAQNVTLQWWGVFMDKDTVQPLIDEYQSQNQGVTIEYADKWSSDLPFDEARTRYKEEVDRVLKANDAVQIPDIFMVHNTWAGDYERFVKTSTTYTAQDLTQSFYPVVSQDFANGGNVYGVPMWMDTFAIVYNKDILASNAVLTVPTDWPAFKSLAQNLTKRESGQVKTAGFAAGLAKNTSFGFDLANILLAQNGVNMTNAKGELSFATDPDSVAALQFYKDFLNRSAPTWSDTFENDSSAFLNGEVAMIIAPSYRLRDLMYYNEQYGLNLKIGIAQIPQLIGQEQALINTPDYWGNMAALNRPNSTAAWNFLKWITQPDQLKKLSDNIKTKDGSFGILYPRSDMADELRTDDYLKIYNESLPFLKSWYMVKGVDVEEAFNTVLDGTSISQSQVSSLEADIQTIISNKGKL